MLAAEINGVRQGANGPVEGWGSGGVQGRQQQPNGRDGQVMARDDALLVVGKMSSRGRRLRHGGYARTGLTARRCCCRGACWWR